MCHVELRRSKAHHSGRNPSMAEAAVPGKNLDAAGDTLE